LLKSSFSGTLLEAGLDEAGRGCLAGPVVAAAVVFPPDYRSRKLNDSKQLTKKERDKLREKIIKDAISWSVAEVCNKQIDQINILQASFRAMHIAVDGLKMTPELLLVDGNRFKPYKTIRHECIIKGDGLYLSIAAASILAKTHRDELMEKLALVHNVYGWEHNMGYPTEFHREAIKTHGLTPFHRLSFKQFPDQLELFE
jgi:ribonuclease HII